MRRVTGYQSHQRHGTVAERSGRSLGASVTDEPGRGRKPGLFVFARLVVTMVIGLFIAGIVHAVK